MTYPPMPDIGLQNGIQPIDVSQLQMPGTQAFAPPSSGQDPNNFVRQIFTQMQQNQQPQQDQSGLIQSILANRQQPEMQDIARAGANTTMSFGAPDLFKAQSPSEAMAMRYESELAPYTSVLKAQNQIGTNIMNQAGGATGVLVNRYMQQNPNASFSDALMAVQAGSGLMRQGLTLGPGGVIATAPGAPNAMGNISNAKKTGEEAATLNFASPIATAKETGKVTGEKLGNQTKVASALLASQAANQNVDAKIDEAINRTSGWTAGPMSMAAGIPGSPQRDLKAVLDTIKTNSGFDVLQEMRNNSPTGGALGQISDKEEYMLQAKLANLDQAQSPAVLAQRLKELKDFRAGMFNRLKQAYKMDYGVEPNLEQRVTPDPGISLPADNLNANSGAATHHFNRATGKVEPIQ